MITKTAILKIIVSLICLLNFALFLQNKYSVLNYLIYYNHYFPYSMAIIILGLTLPLTFAIYMLASLIVKPHLNSHLATTIKLIFGLASLIFFIYYFITDFLGYTIYNFTSLYDGSLISQITLYLTLALSFGFILYSFKKPLSKLLRIEL
jgi:hypothetical protein